MISTGDFPQADKLFQVGMVALAVAEGRHEDAEIETFIGLNSGGRQGRYYRLAAVTLGLIQNERNYSTLTFLGTEYASLQNDAARKDFLARCLVETEVFKAALKYIHEHKPTDDQLKAWFMTFYPGAESTADRRYSTFISYLRDAGLLTHVGRQNDVIKYIGGLVIKQETDIQLPAPTGLIGTAVTRLVANAPTANATGMLRVDVDIQKRERANQVHWKLIAAKAEFLLSKGHEPKENGHVDLYTSSDDETIFYEMKSVDPEKRNLLPQVRKAVSQLYEYRYIFGKPTARICIVTNAEIPTTDSWLIDYLSADRSIAYEWTEDFSSFACPEPAKALLGNFSPIE